MKGSTFFDIVAPVIMVLFLAFSIFCIFAFKDRSDECKKKGGILVKTGSGYVCIDRKTIK